MIACHWPFCLCFSAALSPPWAIRWRIRLTMWKSKFVISLTCSLHL
ncbi:Uncharacterised protein [Vibrio cholerae]|nr:Uncharacterised protein [Vibrio cholerae]